ncbi:MAG: hypothetical protein JXR76_02675 [Deltaproteobacteria bacterium]|nr:hypothetical protein [Deltaproteobacteria bacterium]
MKKVSVKGLVQVANWLTATADKIDRWPSGPLQKQLYPINPGCWSIADKWVMGLL